MSRKNKIKQLLPKLHKWLAVMRRFNAAELKIVDALGITIRPDFFDAGYAAIDLFTDEICGEDDKRHGNWCSYFFYDCQEGKEEREITINGKLRPLRTIEDLAGIIVDTRADQHKLKKG